MRASGSSTLLFTLFFFLSLGCGAFRALAGLDPSAASDEPAVTAAGTYCAVKNAEARSNRAALIQPQLVGSVRRDELAVPLAGENVEWKVRAGLGFDLGKERKALLMDDLAEAECARFQAEHGLVDFTSKAGMLAERAGLAAELKVLAETLARTRKLRMDAEKELEGRTLSLLVVERLRERETRLLGFRAETETRLLASDDKDGIVLEPVDALGERWEAAAMKTASFERAVDSIDSWSLTVAGGIERTAWGSAADTARASGGTRWPLFFSLDFRMSILAPVRPIIESERSQAFTNLVRTSSGSVAVISRETVRQLVATVGIYEELASELRVRIASLDQSLARLPQGIRDRDESVWNLQASRDDLEIKIAGTDARVEFLKKILPMGKKRQAAGDESLASTPSAGTSRQTASEGILVTSGSVSQLSVPAVSMRRPADDGSAAVSLARSELPWVSDGATFRARRRAGSGERVKLRFRYRKLREGRVRLGSGEERTQLGVFLLARDQCNMVYVMWRLDGSAGVPAVDRAGDSAGDSVRRSEVVVQEKRNPRASTHADCANRGYSQVEAEEKAVLPAPGEDTLHVVEAEVQGSTLVIWVDGQVAWRGEIQRNAFPRDGGFAGVRADNVRLEFSLE